LRRLDELVEDVVIYEPLSDRALRRAAELWALMRRAGTPTAPPEALDGDCILAAQAEVAVEPDDVLTVATTNPDHLDRFPGIDAREWTSIAG
jgi:predicted nucleic acid-binding protein